MRSIFTDVLAVHFQASPGKNASLFSCFKPAVTRLLCLLFIYALGFIAVIQKSVACLREGKKSCLELRRWFVALHIIDNMND